MTNPPTAIRLAMLGLGIVLLGGCCTPEKSKDPTFPAAISPAQHYTVRADDSLWMAKTIRFDGEWMIIEAWRAIPPDGSPPPEPTTVWIPRHRVQSIKK
jgi:hypothetical protein